MAFSATWAVYGYHTSTTSTAASYRRSIGVDSSLAFGGGTRSSAILTAIQLNENNTSLHIGSNTTNSASDLCPSPHLNVLARVLDAAAATRSSAFSLNGIYHTTGAITLSTPGKSRGIHFYFKYNDGATSQSTQVTQCQLWAGTSAAVTGVTSGCNIYAVEIATARTDKTWQRPLTGSKYTLTTKAVATSHNWFLGLSILATAVGFNNNNKVKIEATFQ